MANEEQLAILRQGVEVWNDWREENPKYKVCLYEANLSNTNLTNVNLSDCNLSKANLTHANLSNANLRNAKLWFSDCSKANFNNAKLFNIDCAYTNFSGAHLTNTDLTIAFLRNSKLHQADLRHANLMAANISDADLENADLTGAILRYAQLRNAKFCHSKLLKADLLQVQAIEADFSYSTMTGACITEWHITEQTNFNNAICDYIFRGYDEVTKIFRDRLPVNPEKNFKPGEFEEWIKIQAEARKTIDLTFTDGIDWQAFFQSLQGVRDQYPDLDVGLQSIEKKGSAFIIRLETAPGTEQGAIESTQKELYETKLALREAQGEMRVLREMSDVLKALASQGMDKPTNQTVNHAPNFGIQNSGSGSISHFTQNLYNQADEINQLLDSLKKLSQSFPEGQEDIAEQQEIIEGEIADLEHDLKNPDNHDPKRLGRRIKGLKKAGKAILAIAGAAVVGGVTFTDNANKFIDNVDKLGEKIGIEMIQEKSLHN